MHRIQQSSQHKHSRRVCFALSILAHHLAITRASCFHGRLAGLPRRRRHPYHINNIAMVCFANKFSGDSMDINVMQLFIQTVLSCKIVTYF
ncbi:hypothetical protein PVAP13_2KG410705 [Panicum virgatum]|uniref:Secreted protein n=1 Tax=Panicum virgatum TaxID=38727 RepID=A0A8T0WM07_PANVG|nr:hypothetical protein PVAP13_2KG410705 [Panicum virgatum]